MSVCKKFKAAGARPKKMACGGRVKKQSGGSVEAGRKASEWAARLKEQKQKEAYAKARGIKYIKPPPSRSPKQRTRNGMPQVQGADGIWRNQPGLKPKKKN